MPKSAAHTVIANATIACDFALRFVGSCLLVTRRERWPLRYWMAYERPRPFNPLVIHVYNLESPPFPYKMISGCWNVPQAMDDEPGQRVEARVIGHRRCVTNAGCGEFLPCRHIVHQRLE
jgi:hypothetical protein